MHINEISNLRLINQQVLYSNMKSIDDIAKKLCAVQAQDYNMAKWALGVRVPGSTNEMIEASINNGEIIRTHLLRPTWHIVSSDDIYWLLGLTAPHIKTTLKSRQKELEITGYVIRKSKKIFEKELLDGHHLTRQELASKLEESKIRTNDNRASHIFLMAELDGLICSGRIKGKKQTYALLEERVSNKKMFSREEALAELAGRYFITRGPATLQDFAWWSGLSMSDSRNAIEMIKADFISEKFNSSLFWFKDPLLLSKRKNDEIFLLPAFDEFIISYKDRRAALPKENNSKAVSNNGIFRPIIIHEGKVIGIWRPSRKKEKIIIEIQIFKLINNAIKKLIEKSSKKFGNFLGQDVVITYLK